MPINPVPCADDPSGPVDPANQRNVSWVQLCDDNGPFLRQLVVDGSGNVVSEDDFELDGITPYTTSGTVTTCSQESPCDSPTTPLTTVGLCLADGTPIAVVFTRDCDGVITQDGWINLTTGTFSTGAAPAGTISCSQPQQIQNSGILCDINPADGSIYSLVIVEYHYEPDGSIGSVTLINAATGNPYTLQGNLTICPSGDEFPDLITLCDDNNGTVTSFVRDYQRDGTGAITGFNDYTLDGNPYTPTGFVSTCDNIEESPGEPCLHCGAIVLCDSQPGDPENIPGGSTGEGTLENGISWSSVNDTLTGPGWGPFDRSQPWGFTFDSQAALVRFSLDLQSNSCVTLPEGSIEINVPADYTWNPATRQLCGPASTANVAIFELAATNNLLIQQVGTSFVPVAISSVEIADVASVTTFLRTICNDCTGQIVDITDTTLNGDPYVPTGNVGQCISSSPTVASVNNDTELVLLCDVLDESPGESPGEEPVVVQFLRRFTFDNDGSILSQQDLNFDGTPYTVVGNVQSCVSGGSSLDECRNTNSLLVCNTEDQGDVSGNIAATAIANPSPFNAWRGYGDPADTWCQENGNPGTLFTGGSATLGPGPVCSVGGGTHEVIAAAFSDPSVDCDEITVTASVRITNNGPAAGYQGDGRIALWNTSTQTRLAFTNPSPNAPAGHVETVAVSASVSGADLAAGVIAFSVDLEVEHQGAKSWTVDQFTASYIGTCIVTTQFLRNVTVDCVTGQVVSTVDTTLDGSPYTPTGNVGECVSAKPTQEPCGDTELISMCDIIEESPDESPGAEPTIIKFLRRVTFDCNGEISSLADILADGTSYTVVGEAEICEGNLGAGPDEECHNTSSQLLCDHEGTPQITNPSITDGTIDDTSYAGSPNEAAFPLLPKPWTPLWTGGQLIFPVDSNASAGDGVQVYRTVVGLFAGTAPSNCDNDASVDLTVSVRVTNNGPNNASGGSGWLNLYRNGQQRIARTAVQSSTPVGHVETLTVSAPITAADLAAGNISMSLSLETFHGSNTGTQWTADQFSVSAEFDNCSTQFFRNITKDCVGNVTSIVDTTLNGDPYTVSGVVGACTATSTPQQPCGDTETVSMCDIIDESPNESPGESPGDEPTIVKFLRNFTYDCFGNIVSVSDMLPDGTLYEVVGEADICAGISNNTPDECRQSASVLLCDSAGGAETTVPTTTDGAESDVELYPGGTSSPLLPKPWTALWTGSSLIFPSDPDGSAGNGFQVYRNVIGQITGTVPDNCQSANGTLTVAVRVTNDGPTSGTGWDGGLFLYRNKVQIGNDPVVGNAPVGHQQTLTVSIPITASQLADGEIFIALALETFHNDGPTQWTADQFTVSADFEGCATQFFRNITKDCDGNVVSIVDTTLNGDPYTVQGDVGQCTPIADEPDRCASTFTVCRCDLVDESPGEDSPGEPDIVPYTEIWCVPSNGGPPTLIWTYKDDPSVFYGPINPVDCEDISEPGQKIIGVQALRIQLDPGASWNSSSEPLLQAVSVTAIGGNGSITDEFGTTTLHSGENASWSVVHEFDLFLQGPLTLTANDGTLTINLTRAVIQS